MVRSDFAARTLLWLQPYSHAEFHWWLFKKTCQNKRLVADRW